MESSSARLLESHTSQLGRYADDELGIGPSAHRSYGTLPSRPRILKNPPLAASIRRTLAQWGLRRVQSNSSAILRRLSRPVSTYDDPLHTGGNAEADADAKVNGIRVWYSSFTSIDWLHDVIKDSRRFSRLRKSKSLRDRLWLAFDRSLGWIIVTIVGFLTAVVAFLIVRTEQLLFDVKEGYCGSSWWKAKRFCCPHFDGKPNSIRGNRLLKEMCPTWRTWADVLSRDQVAYQDGALEYITYTCIAVFLAILSCFLTLYLTDSTTFITRKESSTGSPASPGRNSKDRNPLLEPKRKVMYYAAGSGIPEIKTILSGVVIHGYLGGRTLFTKAVGLSLSVASGLSLGKEGPLVHIASCVGNIVSRISLKYENNEAKRREILSAACAAGVAVAFGAPIGGILFSLEEVSYFFPSKVMWRSFFCAMIAAITLKLLDPFGTGKIVLFQVTYDKDWHAYELLPFILLGVFGGLYGAYFSKSNHYWSKHIRNKTSLGAHPILEVLLITILTSILCFLNPYTRMGGTELIYNLFRECRTGAGYNRYNNSDLCIVNSGSSSRTWPVIQSILVAMVVKAVLTVITFGIKLPAGIFIPTLGVGACAGRVLGIGMQWLQMMYPDIALFRACKGDTDCVVPGLYAMVGAAAALSGVTRTTVSLAVIMFELTDTLTYAVPVMLSVLVAKTVADALEPKGIYDLVIELNQLPYLDAKHRYMWGNSQISDVTSQDVEVIRLDQRNTVKSLRDLLFQYSASSVDDGFPILRRDRNDEGMRMVGYIGVNELEHGLSLVEDSIDEEVQFHATSSNGLTSSIFSLQEASQTLNPYDFSVYMDQAPLTMANNSPMEFVHQIFVKLGARYVILTDTDGLYKGVIDKKTWLAFLSDLEGGS
ncbi:clc channel [Phlegmacium glaucopus]|nr:clc channel [Phlegmacium glaucopus]